MATIDLIDPMFPAVIVPLPRMTLDEFRTWAYTLDFPEHGRLTFAGGRLIIEMSPEHYETHLAIKDAINLTISGLVRELDLGRYFPDGAWITNREAGVSNEPDASFAAWETLKSGKLAPPSDRSASGSDIEFVGTPDWVCEVVSNSSERKDKELLVAAYHKAGIREYWVIDARGEEVEFQLLVWTPAGYQPAQGRDGWIMSPVFSREFQLTRSRDRLGRWQYDLKQRTPHAT